MYNVNVYVKCKCIFIYLLFTLHFYFYLFKSSLVVYFNYVLRKVYLLIYHVNKIVFYFFFNYLLYLFI